MYRLVMGELRNERPELFDAALRAGPMHVWQLVGDILEEGRRDGEFDPHVDPHPTARFLVSGLMHQALLQTDLHERGLDDTASERIFDAALAVVLRGIAPPAGGGASVGRPPSTGRRRG